MKQEVIDSFHKVSTIVMNYLGWTEIDIEDVAPMYEAIIAEQINSLLEA